MSQVSGPYGFRIAKLLGDLPFSGGMQTYPLLANIPTGLFYGDPVGWSGGLPTQLAASPTTALSVNSPIGIFMGCSYQDPVRGFVNAQYLPPNAISAGATKVFIKVADWPYLVMQIQADGPVLNNQIGMNAAIKNFNAGSILTGDSAVQLTSASIATTASLAVRIYGFANTPTPSPGAGSQPGDPFTDVLVVWNAGVQRYTNPGGQ
jgi:hypothetical protein